VVNAKIAPTVLIMQRLGVGDPTDILLDRAKIAGSVPVRHICLPAELSKDVRPRALRRRYVDGLLDPIRLDRQTLAAKLAGGAMDYNAQYMQCPSLPGGTLFTVDKIEIADALPLRGFQKVIRGWDKAGTSNKKIGKFTAGCKLAIDRDGWFWILDVVRGQWEAAQRERMIQQTALLDGRGVEIWVEEEPGSGGKESAQNTVRSLAGYRVRAERPRTNKVNRADSYAVQVNAGNVKMLRGSWNAAYLREMSEFPFGRYLDQIDASTLAFSKLSRRLIIGAGLGTLAKIRGGVTEDGSLPPRRIGVLR
jgi:predicted phage terminase large subunit-like protein